MSKLTLIGFHNYMQSYNDDLFKNLVVPSGISKDILTGNILLRGGEFEVLYSNPYFLQDAIGIWSAKSQRTFERWVKALSIDYDPLYNYDRTEEWTETDSSSRSTANDVTRSSSDSMESEGSSSASGTLADETYKSSSGTDNGTTTGSSSSTTDATTEEKVSAYNSSAYQPNKTTDNDSTVTTSDSTTTTGTTTGTETGSLDRTTSDSSSESASSSRTGTETEGARGSESFENENIRKGRAYGNIGVTTSQQMLESELDIARWNLIDQITDLFLNEFVIAVY